MILKTDLYSYQRNAVEKLRRLRVGALYMEMGTGKTRTALELVSLRYAAERIGRVLWLCPCSVRKNLEDDLDKHADGWREIIKVAGIESLSASPRIYQEHIDYVTNAPSMLIVDESNLVKNSRAIRSKRILSISEKCPYRLILNGTPVSKTIADLYGQWYLLDWRILGYRSFWAFYANHLEIDENGRIRRALNTDYLIRKIAPYSYRVSREECFELPPKKYTTNSYLLTDEQEMHYDEVADKMLLRVDEMKPETIYRMFSALQAVISGMRVNAWDYKHMRSVPFFENWYDNPRIHALEETLRETDGCQAIIFCKYSSEIEDVLRLLGENAVPFYGNQSQKERLVSLDKFRKGKAKYLVANKTCAGYGLNLQFCHNVIFYSNDWDYATRIQAEDRVYRIGQTSKVFVSDIIADGTLDCRIMKCLGKKESLVDAVKRELTSGNDIRDTLKSWIKQGNKKEGMRIGEALLEQDCV